MPENTSTILQRGVEGSLVNGFGFLCFILCGVMSSRGGTQGLLISDWKRGTARSIV